MRYSLFPYKHKPLLFIRDYVPLTAQRLWSRKCLTRLHIALNFICKKKKKMFFKVWLLTDCMPSCFNTHNSTTHLAVSFHSISCPSTASSSSSSVKSWGGGGPSSSSPRMNRILSAGETAVGRKENLVTEKSILPDFIRYRRGKTHTPSGGRTCPEHIHFYLFVFKGVARLWPLDSSCLLPVFYVLYVRGLCNERRGLYSPFNASWKVVQK